MAKSVTIIFLKQDLTDKEGSLYIRTTEDRKSKRKSLGIKIREYDWNNYFNDKTQLFKSDKRFALGDDINYIIKQKLKELSQNDNELAFLPNEKKSFTKYWEKNIETIENYGTKIKHEVVYAKLKKFLTHKNKTGLLFIEITPTLLRELKFYLAKTKDPKILSSNTVNHYLKIIKSVINKATKDDYYVFGKTPFASIDFTKAATTKNVLSADELVRILKVLSFDDEIYLTRNMFIFQIFANGMRVSDLLLLRYNNFDLRRLKYKMFKTGFNISILLNYNIVDILYIYLESKQSYNSYQKIIKQPFVNDLGEAEMLNMAEIEKRIELNSINEFVTGKSNKELLQDHLENKLVTKYKGYYFKNEDAAKIVILIDAKEKLLLKLEEVYIGSVFTQIRMSKKNSLNDFVFPVLDNEKFKNIDEKNDFSKMTLEQYKMLKHATIVYNRKLKKLQNAAGVSTKLTSHVARHSFTNLLLTMKDVNLFDLSQSLGHSSITITQNYICNGFNLEKIDYLNKELSNQFRQHR